MRKKNMLVVALSLLLILSMPLVAAVKPVSATTDLTITSTSTSTNVSGRISTNTTWTLANSPYIVVGDIVVETESSLQLNLELSSNSPTEQT